MVCNVTRGPGGSSVIICGGRRTTPRPCEFCGAKVPANVGGFECDEPAPERKSGTCDAFMCAACRTRVGENRDLCPRHTPGKLSIALAEIRVQLRNLGAPDSMVAEVSMTRPTFADLVRRIDRAAAWAGLALEIMEGEAQAADADSSSGAGLVLLRDVWRQLRAELKRREVSGGG